MKGLTSGFRSAATAPPRPPRRLLLPLNLSRKFAHKDLSSAALTIEASFSSEKAASTRAKNSQQRQAAGEREFICPRNVWRFWVERTGRESCVCLCFLVLFFWGRSTVFIKDICGEKNVTEECISSQKKARETRDFSLKVKP